MTGPQIELPRDVIGSSRGLLAVEIEDDGMGPYVLIGDRVVLDPDGEMTHGNVVVVLCDGKVGAAWYVEPEDGPPRLERNGGVVLDCSHLHLAGRITMIMRDPPVFNGATPPA